MKELFSSTLFWIYSGLFVGLFGFSLWAGSTGALLSKPMENPKQLKVDKPTRTDMGRDHHRYYPPSGGFHRGK